MIREITENNIRFETELTEDTEAIGSQLIDAEIKQNVIETHTEYKNHVDTANAIEDRLCELSGEIVEQEQSAALRKVLEECI